MVVPPILTADICGGSSKRTLVFRGPYNDKMFLIWCCIPLSPNEIYLSFLCLKEICALVHHHAHDILHNLWPTYEPRSRLPFALNLGNLFILQFHYQVIFVE